METIIVEHQKSRFDWNNLIAAIVMIFIGIALFIWPGESSYVIVYIVAGLVSIAGLILTILYFARKAHPAFGSLSVGLTLLAIGILLLILPEILIKILPFMLGFSLIFSGFNSLQTAIELIRLKVQKWFIPLIFSVVSIICGVLALLNPFNAAAVLMIFLGASLVADGIMLLVSIFLFRKSLS
ncbi:MAG: DUF308 domain-containing protein [Clostridia bacterium]